MLIALGLLLLPLANLGVWTQREVLSTSGFSSLATDVLEQDEVSAALANRLADELVAHVPAALVGTDHPRARPRTS